MGNRGEERRRRGFEVGDVMMEGFNGGEGIVWGVLE